MCRIREQLGFIEVRQRGSHNVMQQRMPDTTITVPVPDHLQRAVETLRSIIRQSGLPRSVFRGTVAGVCQPWGWE